MSPEKSEPTVGELLGTLATTTASLVKQEVHLAKAEVAEKATDAAHGVGMIAMGGSFLHLGALALFFALIVGLGTFVPVWASALAVGLVAVVAGGAVLAKGLKILRDLDPLPRRTLQTLKDDSAWAKEQIQ